MKSIQRVAVILSLALLGATLPALAQYGQEPRAGQPPERRREGGPRHGNPSERTAHLAKQLNLTEEQKSKVEAILKDEQEQREKLRENSSLSREEKREKFEAIRQATSSRIKEILTKEQQKKYDEMQEHMRKGHGDRNKSGESDRPPKPHGDAGPPSQA